VFGAGADIFCACNRRICSPDATFRFPGVRFGVVLGTRRLAARVGDDVAARTLLERRELTAGEALEIGLATAQLPQDAWAGAIEDFQRHAEALAPSTTESVLGCLRPDTRHADMAALVASVSEPGFKERIRAYRDQIAKR
jgi:enoyl-CoA hydratase/carnithine racemase